MFRIYNFAAGGNGTTPAPRDPGSGKVIGGVVGGVALALLLLLLLLVVLCCCCRHGCSCCGCCRPADMKDEEIGKEEDQRENYVSHLA